ncbi:MAG: hypothetical protein AAFY88_22630 [Acidobacteriota bacterium]
MTRTGLIICALLFITNPLFAFGGSGADCNGDGVDDISCSGSRCTSVDEGFQGREGNCTCVVPGGYDSKTCKDDYQAPTISPSAATGLPQVHFSVQPGSVEASAPATAGAQSTVKPVALPSTVAR